jgi:hypothetical protein
MIPFEEETSEQRPAHATHHATATSEEASVEVLACPACAEQNPHAIGVFFRGSRGGRVWCRCGACKSFFDQTPLDAQEEILYAQKTNWGRIDSGKDLNRFKAKMYQSVLSLLTEHCPPPATLMDYGCGYGGFLLESSKRGYDVLGVDILPQAVEHVR